MSFYSKNINRTACNKYSNSLLYLIYTILAHISFHSPIQLCYVASLIETPLEILQLSALDWNASHRVVFLVRNEAFIVRLLRRFFHLIILIDDWLNVTFCSTPSNDKLIKTGDFVYSLAPAAVFFGSVV